ncbi:MAG: potassium transporter Kup [Chromatiales bacterium]
MAIQSLEQDRMERDVTIGIRYDRTRLAALMLGALGVVYGDIGTSPLYALRECFLATHHAIAVNEANVLGVLSVIFWVLILIISVEYVGFILRADNRGEGGILALMALVVGRTRSSAASRPLFIVLGLIGAALLFADAMITPAISVVSAVEGLKVQTALFQPFVVPISLLILIVLYLFQRHGTARIGAVFGPFIVLWFTTLGVIGVSSIAQTPEVLKALNPVHAVQFFVENGWVAFMTMGSIFLVVTGGEALYADMGHFGRKPIQYAWFGLVLPGLALNYFGQGALLLRSPEVLENLFYEAVPGWALLPLVVLATAATVIASQAVISGAFSVASQAVQLGFSPRLTIRQTSEKAIGQIYVPGINILFMIGTLGLVVGFQNSSNLAAAYGVAVSTTMLATTLLLFLATRRVWKWSRLASVAFIIPFLCIDTTFFTSNLLKIPAGGWLPVLFAIVIYTLMDTWKKGRELLGRKLAEENFGVDLFLGSLSGSGGPTRVAGTAVFLTASTTGIPRSLLHNLKHNKVLHDAVILLTVDTERIPYVPPSERIELEALGSGLHRVHINYGFLEQPDIPAALEQIDSPYFRYDPMDTTFFLGRELILIGAARSQMARWRRALFAFMSKNALSAASFFRLPPNRVVEVGYQIEI